MCVWGHVCIPPVCTSLAHRCLSDWVWAQVPSFVHMRGGPSKHVLVCVCMSPSVLVCPGPEDGFVGLCVLRATCEACICTRKPQHRYTYVCVGECMVSICLGLNGYEWLYVCVTWGPCILRCPLAHVGFRNGRLGSSGSRAGERQSRGGKFALSCTRVQGCVHIQARSVHRTHRCTSVRALKSHSWFLHTPSGPGQVGRTHLTLLFRWSAVGSSRARPAGTGGPVGSGCC